MQSYQAETCHTIREIKQQPELWSKAIEQLSAKKEEIERFLRNIETKHKHARVIFTGAGTSAFVGETIYPYIRDAIRKRGWESECVSTTNLTATPYYYLDKEIPTIIVSFARSGNSPESIAAVENSEKIVNNFYEITITCNKDGALAQRVRNTQQQLVLVLPEEANDKSLAMTSSYSTMMIAALYLFHNNKEVFERETTAIAEVGKNMLALSSNSIEKLMKNDFSRLVYLGSGVFEGLSRESALKLLELSAGKVATLYDTTLGFRHGPKSYINKDTNIIVYLSNNPYTRKYDVDMLKELYAYKDRGPIVVLTGIEDQDLVNYCDDVVTLHSDLEDIQLAFAYIIFAQLLAYEKSLQIGLSPDNPSPTGAINRVVQGVTIYPYVGEK